LLIADRYTGAEIIERLEITAEEVLDNFFEEVYNNVYRFDEIVNDLELTQEDYDNVYTQTATEKEYT
tara:strand:- start:2648 stop:2848 length:201 start_codon:yes stop_codon:yes gene_type:complete